MAGTTTNIENSAALDALAVSRQLRQLADHYTGINRSGSKTEVSPQQLLDYLLELQPRDVVYLPSLESALQQLTSDTGDLPEECRAARWFSDQVTGFVLKQLKPHAELVGHIHRLLLLCGCRWLIRPDAFLQPDHLLTQQIRGALDQARFWEPATVATGNRFPVLLESCTQSVANIGQSDRQSLMTLRQCLDSYLQRHGLRSRQIEKRLIQHEKNSANIALARQTVTEFVEQRLYSKPMPEEVNRFIRNTLIGDLQHLVISQGVDSACWSRWKRLLQVISWAYGGAEENAQLSSTQKAAWRKKRDTLLPPILEGLNQDYFQDFLDQTGYPQFLHFLMGSFLQLLQDKPAPCVHFQQLDSVQPAPGFLLDQSMLDELQECQIGAWYRFETEAGEARRARLILRLPEKNLLLFSGYHNDVLRYGFDDFARAIALKTVTPIADANVYIRGLQHALALLRTRIEECEQLQRLDAEALQRKQAAEKAEQEARILAQKISDESRYELDSDERLEHENSLQQLGCGSWLLWHKSAQEQVRMKLSVKLASKDKYIFTDRIGTRVAEFSHEDLVQLLASNKLQILSTQTNFESSLEQIVRGLRKNK